jgi:hypothetical protein
MKFFFMLFISCLMASSAFSQWTQITALPPHQGSGSEMLLLSDGSVIVTRYLGNGTTQFWDKLTPDINGSYVNGTWTSTAPMANNRQAFSSQVLKDGRVYVAGGEFGGGGFSAEVYDPLTNIWTNAPNPGPFISDANTELLDNGTVLQATSGSSYADTYIYDPISNTYTAGPTCLGETAETVWIKLPDNSVLFVDITTGINSERYIPSTNIWIADGTVPVNLYNSSWECGGAVLLPDGRALFLGGSGHNAYYTPSGSTTPGTWAAAPDFPTGQGAIDAPVVIMDNGKVLCETIDKTGFLTGITDPITFYEFDPATNVFTAVAGPDGGATYNAQSQATSYLQLPDGNVLFMNSAPAPLYIYTPTGTPLASWRPTISSFTQTGPNTYQITGTQFNGISQGASFGDDKQMRTNYPLVRLVNGTNVYYARTFNWNSTGVQRGSAPDNVTFTLPAGLPIAPYSLYVVANGIASSPVQFCPSDITITGSYSTAYTPSSTWIKSSGQTTILNTASVKLDADPVAGYVLFQPTASTDYFLSAPSNTSAVFVAQPLDGCGANIPARPAITDDNTPVVVAPENITINVYPNPATNSFNVYSNSSMNGAKLELFNINGRMQNIQIQDVSSYSKQVTWSHLAKGSYFLKIITNDKTQVSKIIIE